MTGKINKIMLKICLGLLIFLISGSYGSVPVVNELKIIGSSRGVALSISADSPFNAQFENKGSYVIDIILQNCIYGLGSFTYDKFKKNAPVRKISTIEAQNGNTITISIELKSKSCFPVKTNKKGNKWLALLSQKCTTDFVWYGSDQLNTINVDSLNGKAKNDAILEKISALQRDNVCKLSFLFSSKAKRKIKQSGDSLLILFKDAVNATGKNRYNLPESISFESVELKQKSYNDRQWLGVAVKLNSEVSVMPISAITSIGQSLVLYMKTENRNISLWSSKNGCEGEYAFYEPSDYDVDMESLSKRAQIDVKSTEEHEEYFMVNDEQKRFSSAIKKENEELVNSDIKISNKTEKIVAEKIEIENKTNINKDKQYLIATADRINVRSKPSMKSNVIDQIDYGKKLELVDRNGAWANISYDKNDGWVHNSLLTKSGMVSEKEPENEDIASVQTLNENIKKVSIHLPVDTQPETSDKEHKIEYGETGRDPFVPLIRDTISENGRPFVENLRLVGIIYDTNDRIALFEDFKNLNKPFALRENDRVEYGKVLKIYRDKVVFLITEFGISRSFTMSLSSLSDQEVRKQ